MTIARIGQWASPPLSRRPAADGSGKGHRLRTALNVGTGHAGANLNTRLVDENEMKIDIDQLTEAELVDLNNRIVERLRFLHDMRSHAKMLEFAIGDRVEFQPDNHPLVVGMLTRYNRRTVTVITDTGQRWNVAPQLVRRAAQGDAQESAGGKVVPLNRK
jgi:hypothetical protein